MPDKKKTTSDQEQALIKLGSELAASRAEVANLQSLTNEQIDEKDKYIHDLTQRLELSIKAKKGIEEEQELLKTASEESIKKLNAKSKAELEEAERTARLSRIELVSDNEKLKAEITNLQKTVKDHDTQLKTYIAELKAKDAEISELQLRISEAESELDSALEELENTATSLQESNQNLNELSQQQTPFLIIPSPSLADQLHEAEKNTQSINGDEPAISPKNLAPQMIDAANQGTPSPRLSDANSEDPPSPVSSASSAISENRFSSPESVIKSVELSPEPISIEAQSYTSLILEKIKAIKEIQSGKKLVYQIKTMKDILDKVALLYKNTDIKISDATNKKILDVLENVAENGSENENQLKLEGLMRDIKITYKNKTSSIAQTTLQAPKVEDKTPPPNTKRPIISVSNPIGVADIVSGNKTLTLAASPPLGAEAILSVNNTPTMSTIQVHEALPKAQTSTTNTVNQEESVIIQAKDPTQSAAFSTVAVEKFALTSAINQTLYEKMESATPTTNPTLSSAFQSNKDSGMLAKIIVETASDYANTFLLSNQKLSAMNKDLQERLNKENLKKIEIADITKILPEYKKDQIVTQKIASEWAIAHLLDQVEKKNLTELTFTESTTKDGKPAWTYGDNGKVFTYSWDSENQQFNIEKPTEDFTGIIPLEREDGGHDFLQIENGNITFNQMSDKADKRMGKLMEYQEKPTTLLLRHQVAVPGSTHSR